LGVALATAGVRVLRALPAGGGAHIPRLDEVNVDARVLGVAAGIVVLAALGISLIPALRSASLALSALLGSAGRSLTAGRTQQRARQALVVSQLALTLALLSGAALMARSFLRLRAVQPGFDPAHALSFRVALPKSAYPAPEDPARFVIRALEAMSAVPGISAAGAATKLPLTTEARQDTAVFVEGQPLPPGTMPALHQVVYASPGYFRAMGIPLLQGSTFQRPDPANAPREVIVSRSVAERYWKGQPVVGRRVRMNARGPWQTIVGVAGDVRGTALEAPPDETIYVPLVVALGSDSTGATRFTPRDIGFVARSAQGAEVVAAAAERVVRALDPSVPLYAVQPMADVVRRAEARTTFTLLLLGIASAVALALGAVGTYGVIAYVVSLRQREIAVRLALGAPPARVLRMVLLQALSLVVLGIVLGLAGAMGATRVLAALLYGVSPTDAVALAGAALVLVAVGVAASWAPARHAARVDPGMVLRGE
ncbi:MAG TPA: FtsX-like permease family protein, partial [Gemmatimonadaceae bacterium]|nr:FtsX-like permease family protein [Gemmatimonadaceae bacterium]